MGSAHVQSGTIVGFAGWSLHRGRVECCGESVWGTLCTLRCDVGGMAACSLFEGGSFPR